MLRPRLFESIVSELRSYLFYVRAFRFYTFGYFEFITTLELMSADPLGSCVFIIYYSLFVIYYVLFIFILSYHLLFDI